MCEIKRQKWRKCQDKAGCCTVIWAAKGNESWNQKLQETRVVLRVYLAKGWLAQGRFQESELIQELEFYFLCEKQI